MSKRVGAVTPTESLVNRSVSTKQLALCEPTALEVLNRPGAGLTRLLRGMIPITWSTAADRMGVYQRELEPYIGSAYSKSQVNAALRDERLGRALFALDEATSRVDQDHPRLARLTVPVWMIEPLSGLKNQRRRRQRLAADARQAAADLKK